MQSYTLKLTHRHAHTQRHSRIPEVENQGWKNPTWDDPFSPVPEAGESRWARIGLWVPRTHGIGRGKNEETPDRGVEREGRNAESGCVCEEALGGARCSSTLLRYHSSNPIFQMSPRSRQSETIPRFYGSSDVPQRGTRFPEGPTGFLSFLPAWSRSRPVTLVRLQLALADSALHIPRSQTLHQAATDPGTPSQG